jgi:hypothetical protein
MITGNKEPLISFLSLDVQVFLALRARIKRW